jgi:alpha-L-fucosidase
MKPHHTVAAILAFCIPAHADTPANLKHLKGGSPELLPAAPQTVEKITAPLEQEAEINARVSNWKQAKFGMFIHFGVYSRLEGQWQGKNIPGNAEWVQYNANIPNDVYEAEARKFNPVKFSATEWVAAAKSAGMKYIVITAKHHDGFCLWPSKIGDFNLPSVTPFKRDLLKELSDETRGQGLGIGFYYSNDLDWHLNMLNNNDGADLRTQKRFMEGAPGRGMGPDLARKDPANFDRYYREVAMPQVRELLTEYGPLVSLFFDGNPAQPTVAQGLAMRSMIRGLQPQVVFNNRLRSVPGDYFSYEQRLPQGVDPRHWEGCMTMNGTWGFRRTDTNWKSTPKLIFTMVDAVSKGGNFLLNVGPDAEGVIPNACVTTLKEIGKWMETNGEAIYGTGPTAFGPEYGSVDPARKDRNGHPVFNADTAWRCTTKPGKIYIHIFKWPAGKIELPGFKSKVTKAYLLADRSHALEFSQAEDQLSVSLPANAPDALGSVLCLDLVPNAIR